MDGVNHSMHECPSNRYLVIANVSKKNNVKFLINAAAAYRFQIILVGCLNMSDLHVDPELKFVHMERKINTVSWNRNS